MASHKIQHMIEKSDSRGNLRFTATVQIQIEVIFVFLSYFAEFARFLPFFLHDSRNRPEQLLQLRFLTNGDTRETWPDILASFAHQDAAPLQLAKNCGAVLAKIGQDEISSAGKYTNASLF